MRSTLSTLVATIAVGALLAASPLAAQDAQGRLWDAAIAGDTLEIRQALADGAKIDSLDTRTNPNGRMALNWAAWNNRVPAIQMLLAMGAPIEAINRTGFSALSHAAESGSTDAARALLAAGANTQHANNAGYTPAEIAHENGNDDIAAMIEASEQNAEQPTQQ